MHRNLLKIVFKNSRQFSKSAILNGCGALVYSPNAKLNKTIADKFLCLPIPECKVLLTYIWIDGTGHHLRSKSRTLNYIPSCVEEFPNWAYESESTYQDTCGKGDMLLFPVAVYNDPFRRGQSKLVLCETYTPDKRPSETNHRSSCAEVFKAVCHEEPMFGIEQEFHLLDCDRRPFGWPKDLGEPLPIGSYYCGVGGRRVYGRDIMECMYRACLYAGVDLYGMNPEVQPSQWQFQTGPTIGIKAGDDLWMSRYICTRIAEEFGLEVSLKGKTLPNWAGSGCHVHFSTKTMREDGGMKAIEQAVCKLSKRHLEHIVRYDARNGMDCVGRLTGNKYVSSVHEFTSGIGVRNKSVRITQETVDNGKGCLEDRRPAANADPYLVLDCILRTTLLDDV